MFLWKPRSSTRRIVIHGDHFEGAAQLRANGRVNGLLDVGYHFVIERSAKVVYTRPHHTTGSHIAGLNHDSIGVYVATYEHALTDLQVEALARVVQGLHAIYGKIAVQGHNEVAKRFAKRCCPGVDMKQLRERIGA